MVLFHDSFSGSWNAETKSERHLQRELWTGVFFVDFVFLFCTVFVLELLWLYSLLVFAIICVRLYFVLVFVFVL